MPIHPTAIIHPNAEIDKTVDIGPYVVIDEGVRIGAGTRILPFVTINGQTTIGQDNVIHMGAVIGHEPQDLSYDGSPRRLVIGDRNTIREHVTIHRSTQEEGETRIGNDCFLMALSHVAHDCRVGDRVIIANNSVLGGHVEVQEGVNISSLCGIHQFVRIGRLAMLQGLSGFSKDVAPFMMACGVNTIAGVNVVGLRRAGFSPQARSQIGKAHKILCRQRFSVPRAVKELKAGGFGPEVQEIIAFIESSRKGIVTAPAKA